MGEPQTLNPKPETLNAYAHLHCHTQFSVLQSTIKVQELVNKAFELGMPGVAITDHANMYGIYHFVDAVDAVNAKIKLENAKIEAGEADMADTLAEVRKLPQYNGRAAAMGFCYGGPYAILGPERLGYAAGITTATRPCY